MPYWEIVMSSSPTRLIEWLWLIRADFEEPGGLRITATDARDRWPLDPTRTSAILDALVQARYLSLSSDGVYSRRLESADGVRVPDTRYEHAAQPGSMSPN